jgi:hypothetical protein
VPVLQFAPPVWNLVIQAWDGRLWAYVDGERVVADYRPE